MLLPLCPEILYPIPLFDIKPHVTATIIFEDRNLG